MEDQKDDGAESSPSTTATKAIAPISAIPKPANTISLSNKFMGWVRKHWKAITAISAAIAAIVTFLGGCTEIPNNVMSWFINFRGLSSKPEAPVPSSTNVVFVTTTNIVVVTNISRVSRDFVPGTQVTYGDLNEALPFGYTVMSFSGDKWTYQPPQDGRLQHRIKEVRITPNFAKGTVTWTVPDFGFTGTNMTPGGRGFYGAGIKVTDTKPMKPLNRLYRNPVMAFPTEPEMHTATLSDHQRFPVFVLGFRIITTNRAPVIGEPD